MAPGEFQGSETRSPPLVPSQVQVQRFPKSFHLFLLHSTLLVPSEEGRPAGPAPPPTRVPIIVPRRTGYRNGPDADGVSRTILTSHNPEVPGFPRRNHPT